MAYFLKDLPFTEEGKKLNLSEEDRDRFRLVYKKDGEDWILHDIWGEGGDYGDDCIVVPLESTYAGWQTLKQGTEFANAIGTTNDANPAGIKSWIALWKCLSLAITKTNPSNVRCCTNGYKLYNANSEKNNSFYSYRKLQKCNIWPGNDNCWTVGGHVVLGRIPQTALVNMPVYILPICQRHNVMKNDGYMQLREDTFAVLLNYGICQNAYLAQHPLETHEKI